MDDLESDDGGGGVVINGLVANFGGQGLCH